MPLAVNEIYDKVVEKYQNNKRLDHILGVANVSKNLAIIYGEDPEKAYVIGLLHDYMKYESIDEMLKVIDDKEIEEKFRMAPQIYHAYASAKCAENIFNITDKEIINGIKYHVYGRLHMTMLEKIVVLADYIEPTRYYPTCIEVRKIVEEGNFDKAMYLCIKYAIESVVAQGNHPMEEQYEILKELYNKWNY